MSALPSPSKSFSCAPRGVKCLDQVQPAMAHIGAYGHRLSHSAAALDSLMLDRRFRNKAAAPETKGALKEVPHPAA